MLNALCESKKCFFKGDTHVNKEVIVHSLKAAVRLLLDCEDEIARDHVGNLLCFSLEKHLISILHTFLNLHGQCLHIVYNFSSLAVGAVLSSNLTSSTTSVASCLHLHLHAKANLDLLHYNALAIALWTLFGLSILCSCPSTFRAINISSN